MRWSWIVLLGVVAAGVYAFFGSSEGGESTATTTPAADQTAKLEDLGLTTEEQKRESEAVQLVSALSDPAQASDPALWSRILHEYGDTLTARRAAYKKGVELYQATPSVREGADKRIAHLDRVRRLLSRGINLPEMFQANGADTEARTRLIQVLADANREVMTWPAGLPGVTKPYEVEPGLVPVQIVWREHVPAGVNAILYWNQGGNLDPRRLQAGQKLLLPLEPLRLEVLQDVHRLSIWIGDWFVKEFRVGVGRDESPTPVGTFQIVDKQVNPPWTTTIDGRKVVIPPNDPRNELGAVWMAIQSPQWPRSAGFGIHGTIKPETVGTHCSNGCVRLRNDQATEVFDWARREGNGVAATEVSIRYK